MQEYSLDSTFIIECSWRNVKYLFVLESFLSIPPSCKLWFIHLYIYVSHLPKFTKHMREGIIAYKHVSYSSNIEALK